ncbi:ArsR/SmtB family transcription factor [Nocardioides alkalitolerans]|uniref:ArsR/SmtB family transcription factor n=1 Tax=Nocardioides alkalitolerans TaxID=281714 RepID=UPI0005BA1227|nr:metalloregulator ArsR/SmtB family transcription factor [Nocardioides alkalitolerans]
MRADKQTLTSYDATHDVPDDEVDLAVEIFRLLADATRVRLVWALRDGELAVNTLADRVGKPQAAVSQHLAKLRMGRMVTTRRQGNQVFYRIANDHVRTLVVDAVHHAEHAAGGVPAHHARTAPRGAAE